MYNQSILISINPSVWYYLLVRRVYSHTYSYYASFFYSSTTTLLVGRLAGSQQLIQLGRLGHQSVIQDGRTALHTLHRCQALEIDHCHDQLRLDAYILHQGIAQRDRLGAEKKKKKQKKNVWNNRKRNCTSTRYTNSPQKDTPQCQALSPWARCWSPD